MQSIYFSRYADQFLNRYENRQNKQKTYQVTIENGKNDESINENTMSINFAEYDEHENGFYYDEQSVTKKNSDEAFIDFVNLKATCKHCRKIFSFNNKLYYHLRREQCFKKLLKITSIKIIFELNFFSKCSEISIIIKTTIYSKETP